MSTLGFGVDIGGSGIKAAVVDLGTGDFVGDRFKVATPAPCTVDALTATVAGVVDHFGWERPLGCTYPGVVTSGVARTAANLDHSLIGQDLAARLGGALDRTVTMANDADAAGLAEVAFGAARDVRGTVLLVTLGTGIGTALIRDGELVPNVELGHLEVGGEDAERSTSAAAREREEISWPEYAARLQRYLSRLEAYMWPDLFVIGGGVSRRAKKFVPLLELRTPVVAATLENRAGIVGAARLAATAAISPA